MPSSAKPEKRNRSELEMGDLKETVIKARELLTLTVEWIPNNRALFVSDVVHMAAIRLQRDIKDFLAETRHLLEDEGQRHEEK
jgi:hypothetical protein